MDFIPEQGSARFSPTLRGCVTPNSQMARALGEVAGEALGAVVANIDRSLIFEAVDCACVEHFDRLATEWLCHFRLIGRLRMALCDTTTRRNGLHVNGSRQNRRQDSDALGLKRTELSEASRELRLWGRHLQALTGKTDDRVVCAVLEALAEEANCLAAETEDLLSSSKIEKDL